MQIINRDLSAEKDGVPGYLAHPDRKEPGPGVLIVHHHFGVTGNMKVNVCNFAKLGYTTFVPDLYKMLGESDGVHEAQKKTSDGQFTEIISGGRDSGSGRWDSRTSWIASAAFAFKVSKMVSSSSRSEPPSMRPRT